jgi:hypothetical protein
MAAVLKLLKNEVGAKYSEGYNGHAKCCDCADCANFRACDVLRRAVAHKVRIVDERATVVVRSYVVRAHARRNKNHLSAYPSTLKLLREMLKEAKVKAR